MLALRFEMESDWAFPPGAALHSLKRSRRMSVEPCVSPECCAKKASLSPVSGAGARSFESGCGRGALFSRLNPAEDEDEQDEDEDGQEEALRGGRSERKTMVRMCEAQEFSFGVSGDFGDAEDFDLGPPPPTGPVLMRQRAMDFTAAREAKAASLAQGVDPRATANPSAALRSTSLISSSSALNRRSRFMGT